MFLNKSEQRKTNRTIKKGVTKDHTPQDCTDIGGASLVSFEGQTKEGVHPYSSVIPVHHDVDTRFLR
jgi:hypothetical protein